MKISRRRFIAGAAGAGGIALIPTAILDRVVAATTSSATDTWFFLSPAEQATARALCARLVPTGSDPVASPGASEARAVLFIDRFLSAFELPATLADGPAIWLTGNFSGRQPYPDPADGEASASSPPDAFLSDSGQAHFVSPDARQALAWRAQLYGASVLTDAARTNPTLATWAQQVASGLIPGVSAGGLRQVYRAGLAAFDSWSRALFLTPFAGAQPLEQDAMIAAAGNLVIDQIGPSLPPLPLVPPAAAEQLYPVILDHTFQACYGLPEYRWSRQNPVWQEIGYDGDTEPLGNSVYDENLAPPGEGANQGFGQAGVFVPRGGYREFRPVSYPDAAQPPLSLSELDRVLNAGRRK